MHANDILSIGYLAHRTGLSVSAIRFYEEKGLITPHRNKGGHRRYMRSDIRRLSFIMIAQQLGCSIEDIAGYMKKLPNSRTPTAKDWAKISQEFKVILDQQIERLTRTRDRLDGCIGCGCLSLEHCQLYNADDKVSKRGNGPRLIL